MLLLTFIKFLYSYIHQVCIWPRNNRHVNALSNQFAIEPSDLFMTINSRVRVVSCLSTNRNKSDFYANTFTVNF